MNTAHALRSGLLGLALLPLLSGCGDDDAEDPRFEPARADLFDPSVTTVALEVDYATGAEPTTTGIRLQMPWQLFAANAEALFEGTGKSVEVPLTLDEMTEIGSPGMPSYDVNEILDVAEANWTDRGSDTRRVFYVVYLDGPFRDESGVRDTVLGVSIGDTGVIAMFEPVIRNASASAFVEQTTLVHEFGHAIGLVDNGVPMVVPHKDEAHGAHCTNDRCVMYWLNEGASDLVEFANRFVLTGETVVFGDECLTDVRTAAMVR